MLQCEFCSNKESIEQSTKSIHEYNLKEALHSLENYHEQKINKEVQCNKCGATFTMTSYSVSSNCPYCNTPSITKFVKEITPESLIPFQVSQQEAQKIFKKWLGSLWLAPSKLKEFIHDTKRLKGYYLPHWTYDSQTDTDYHGQRGDIYYVDVERTVIVNGRKERRVVQEARIQWYPVSGHVQNFFDDITIGASKTIAHNILESLTPWNTKVLIPFNQKYLSGFDSEEYTIGLNNGFEFAKIKMDKVIRQDIRFQIGGDQQRIDYMHTQYSNTTYKNVLFPIWTAQFQWKNKIYNYAINGQTGKVIGERPYSWTKIIFLILTIGLVVGAGLYLDQHPNLINNFR